MNGLGLIPERECRTPENDSALAEMIAHAVPFAAPGGPIPDAVDYRSWLRGSEFIRNQGPRPSCCGHALSNAGFLLNMIDTAQRGRPMRTLMSAWFCWRRAQFRCGLSGETGATISGAVKAAKLDGFPLETTEKYNPARRDINVSPAAVEEGAQHPLIGMASNVKGNWDAVIQGIGTGSGVVIVGTKWTASLSGARGGYVNGIGGQFYGYHATLWAGYHTERGERWIQAINSHGTQSGDGGMYYLNRRDHDALTRDPNAECWLVSDLREYGTTSRDMGWADKFGIRFG